MKLIRVTILVLVLVVISGSGNGQESAGEIGPAKPGVRFTPSVMAVSKAMPSVVNISTEKVMLKTSPLDDVFRQFFGNTWQDSLRQYPSRSLGSGVIIDPDGYLLTNYHVIERASKTTATMAEGGMQFEATVIATMQETDLALLKLEAYEPVESFPYIEFERADDLLLGEDVMTLGNPFGLGGSVSKGILSSKNRRSLPTSEQLEVDDWLQTDAAINLGNSGGPLINLNGNLIGINVATISEGENIGFAIPIRRVMETIAYIFNPEKITRTWIGLQLNPIAQTPTVDRVETNSPAFQAGLSAGDKITHFNNRSLDNLFQLQKFLTYAKPNTKIFLTVEKPDNNRKILELTPKSLSEFFNEDYLRERTGLVLKDISDLSLRAQGSSEGMALQIQEIEEASAAAEAGLLPGDVITGINRLTFERLEDLGWWLSYFNQGDSIDVEIRRPEYLITGQTRYFSYRGVLKIN